MNIKIIIGLITFLQLLFAISIYAQKSFIVNTTDIAFTPSKITISPGDTVKWINTSKGLHNVIADDESFSSGDPSMDEWTYIYVFINEGVNHYYCSIHGNKGGVGMSGIIMVQSSKNNSTRSIKK